MPSEQQRHQGPYRVPTISVVMPVYNAATYLQQAIDSILNQSFTDFELLVIDDGSTDQSVEIISAITDKRIVFLRNERNRGLIYTLNRGLEYARGIYVARMDADDISHQARFALQVEYMDQHPEIGVCGTWMETFGGQVSQIVKNPIDPAMARCLLLFRTVVVHPSVMIRRSILADYGLRYSPEYQHAEDYEFWNRFSRVTSITNLPQVLLRYRMSDEQISRKHWQAQMQSHQRAQVEILCLLGIAPTPQEVALHHAISFLRELPDLQCLEAAANWLLRLRAANHRSKCYPEPELCVVLREYWHLICQCNESLDPKGVRQFWHEQDNRFAT